MRFLVKLFGVLLVFSLGIVAGFLLSPVKQGCGNSTTYNFKDLPKEDDYEEEELGI